MQVRGIDVSSYNGDIDFQKVKESGIEFVIIKAGEWDHTVPKFEENFAAAKQAGLHVGFYWFSDAETVFESEKEANACITALKGKQFDYPVFIDLENDFQHEKGKETCSGIVRTFCEKLKNSGYYTGLYTASSWLDDVIEEDIKKKYVIWVADWRGYVGYDGEYGLWQCGVGDIPGVTGEVDLDYSYVDFPSIIAEGGFNNYPKRDSENAGDSNGDCRDVANTLSIRGASPILSGEKWFLIDENCEFTLETLPYAKVNVYLVGGGGDGAEWFREQGTPEEVFAIAKKSRGGCVFKKQIYITGNVNCKAVVADRNDPAGTTLQIGEELYKCDDSGFVRRKATASGNAKIDEGGNFNAENGANGVETPYGWVGSSGGGGGTYSIQNLQRITVNAGKGGIGAGDGGAVGENGKDAVNYGCGGGAAGFGGFPSDGSVVETKAGLGMPGCIIFEMLDGGMCSGNTESSGGSLGSSSGCYLPCYFSCPDPAESTSTCTTETDYRLVYNGSVPIVTKNTVTTETGGGEVSNVEDKASDSADKASVGTNKRDCGCAGSSLGNACSCVRGRGKGGCTSYDAAKWGENWLLFDKTGDYTLNIDEETSLKIYLVGGGSDGKDGTYYNKVAYGGDGGMGGYVNIVRDVIVQSGSLKFSVTIGGRGNSVGTSIIIDDREYCCNGSGCTVTEFGGQSACGYFRSSGKFVVKNGGNGANGVETPYGWVGSSGGGGAAYNSSKTANRGKGGIGAGAGGTVISRQTSKGENASGYGCGGGGGAASPTGWCEGGRGKQGCVLITW